MHAHCDWGIDILFVFDQIYARVTYVASVVTPQLLSFIDMRTQPSLPQQVDHEFFISQYGSPLRLPQPTASTAWSRSSMVLPGRARMCHRDGREQRDKLKINLPQAGSQQTPQLQKTKERCEASMFTATGPFLKSASFSASSSPGVTLV